MNQYYPSGNYCMPQQTIFPQPQGNVYMIQNSLEVANIPTGAGITVAICQPESLLYVKTIQNGAPSLIAYKLSPYNDKPATQATPIEERVAELEKKFDALIGGKKNELSDSKSASSAKWET